VERGIADIDLDAADVDRASGSTSAAFEEVSATRFLDGQGWIRRLQGAFQRFEWDVLRQKPSLSAPL